MTPTFLDAVHADPWAQDFIDLPTLNRQASDAIESAIKRVRDLARTDSKALRPVSLTVLGPAGAGKTHLFARLRNRLGPRAVFVHIRPLVGTDMTHRFILHEIVRQLGYSTGSLRQIDALVGALLAQILGKGPEFPRFHIEDYSHLTAEMRVARLERALEHVLETWQSADESYIRRLLSVPFADAPTQRALLAWLSGRELDSTQLGRIGATNALAEELIVPALQSLAAVAAVGAPIVLVFDQLENLIDRDRESSRLLSYAQLTTDLVDTAHGLVVVQMALDTEWDRSIEPAFNLAQRSRLSMNRIVLGLPTPREREDLLRMWIERLPDRTTPFPWPLRERTLSNLCEQPGMTPRMLLIALRELLANPERDDGAAVVSRANPPAVDGADEALLREGALESEWDEQMFLARVALDEAAQQNRCIDAAELTDGILAAIQFAPGLKLKDVKPSRAAAIQLDRPAGTLGVCLLQQAHPRSIGSALSKLGDVAREQHLLIIRERAYDFPPTWTDTLARRAALIENPHVKWFQLDREDAARLLALSNLLKSAKSRDVTDHRGRSLDEETVAEWVTRTRGVPTWPVALGLMGEVPMDREITHDEPCTPCDMSNGLALPILLRLRVASVDRLVREALRIEPGATRSGVLEELEHAGGRVRWFGRSLAYLEDVP